MTNQSVPPSRSERPATRTRHRHGVRAGDHRAGRQRALIGTLLAVALGLLALALPSAAGAIGHGKPAAWIAAAAPQRTHAGGAPSRSAARSTAPAAAAVVPTISSPSASSAPSAPPLPPPPSVAAPSPAVVAHPATTPSAAAPTPLAGSAAPADAGAEAQVLALVNQQRAAAGCAALIPSSALADLARAHSADMRDRGYFAHNTPDGLSPFDRADAAGITTMRAENIAMGQATPADVMASWMASPGHRANILDCSMRTLGVGVAYGAGGPWWTQDFGF